MPIDINIARRMRRLLALRGHLITFHVDTPTSSSGKKHQTPVLILQEVKQTSAGNVLIKGLDVTKMANVEKDVFNCMRAFRIDRITSQITDLGRIESRYTEPQPDAQGYIAL